MLRRLLEPTRWELGALERWSSARSACSWRGCSTRASLLPAALFVVVMGCHSITAVGADRLRRSDM